MAVLSTAGEVISVRHLWDRLKTAMMHLPWLAIVFFVIGFTGTVIPSVTGGHIPGDIRDGRFNLYLLEHFFRSLCRDEVSFIFAPFYFPFPATIGFSDSHWGTAPVYAFFRFLGIAPMDAFCCWFSVGVLLTYACAYLVLRKLELRELGSGIGAFLFTFCLPVSMQCMHAQLTYRYAVPLGLYCLHRYLATRLPFWGSLMVLCLGLQLLATFYIGIFLGYLLAAWVLSWVLLKTLHEGLPIGAALRGLLPSVKERKSDQIVACGLLLIAFVLIALALLPNLTAARLYHFVRSWSEIQSMLPRPASYFLTDVSRIWSSSSPLFASIPMRWEQNMFLGAVALIAVLFAFAGGVSPRQAPLLFLARTSFLLLLVMTLFVFGNSAYCFVACIPGFNAVRAVSRIILVMAFPVAIMTGLFIERIYQRPSATGFWRIAAVALLGFCLFETVDIKPYRDSKKNWQKRVDDLESRVVASLGRPVVRNEVIVCLQPAKERMDCPDWVLELDAMLLAQKLCLRTLNGYSGNEPPGWRRICNRDDITGVIASANSFRKKNGLSPVSLDPAMVLAIDPAPVSSRPSL
jgi:hypothetical protein